MMVAAGIVGVIGVIGLVVGLMQKHKAGRLASAPFAKTGDVVSKGAALADPKGAISVEGAVVCPAPLTAPASGTPCLYYSLSVVGTWKEGDQNKSHDYVDQKAAAEFSVDDGSGAVRVIAKDGGDFEPLEKTFDETKKEGFLADLKNTLGNKEPIVFGKYAFDNPPMSKANRFNCVEKVLKVQPRLFVLGKLEQGAIVAPKWTSLILSNKSRDVLLGATMKSARNFLIGGGALLAIGLILGLVARFV